MKSLHFASLASNRLPQKHKHPGALIVINPVFHIKKASLVQKRKSSPEHLLQAAWIPHCRQVGGGFGSPGVSAEGTSTFSLQQLAHSLMPKSESSSHPSAGPLPQGRSQVTIFIAKLPFPGLVWVPFAPGAEVFLMTCWVTPCGAEQQHCSVILKAGHGPYGVHCINT